MKSIAAAAAKRQKTRDKRPKGPTEFGAMTPKHRLQSLGRDRKFLYEQDKGSPSRDIPYTPGPAEWITRAEQYSKRRTAHFALKKSGQDFNILGQAMTSGGHAGHGVY